MKEHTASAEHVSITIHEQLLLPAQLSIPDKCRGVIVLISEEEQTQSYFKPLTTYVAESLLKERYATLLVDLLTTEERAAEEKQLERLKSRVFKVKEWISKHPQLEHLDTGLFVNDAQAVALSRQMPDEEITVMVINNHRTMAAVPSAFHQLLNVFSEGAVTVSPAAQYQSGQKLTLSREKENADMVHIRHVSEQTHSFEELSVQTSEWFLRYL